MDKEKEKDVLSRGLRMAIETNRLVIKGERVTIIPTELAIRLYNLLSENEKLVLDN